ncbi:replication/maintenance protein RepL, partial [Helicobacter sp. 23-1045]
VRTKATKGYKVNEDYKDRGIVTTFEGVRKFKDLETGKIVEMEMVTKKVKHGLKGGWRRVYLENFMEILTGIYRAGRKIDVIEFILDNLDSNNKFTMSQAQVVEKTKVSKPIVIETYRYLTKKDFWRKDGTCYRVNTNFVCAFGSDRKNAMIALKYSDLDEPSLF